MWGGPRGLRAFIGEPVGGGEAWASGGGGGQDRFEFGSSWEVQLLGVNGATGVTGDGHRGARVGQGVVHDGVIAAGAQQDPDGGGVDAGSTQAVVDDSDVEAELAQCSGLNRPILSSMTT